MKNLIVVNGESYWAPLFPDYDVHQRRLQSTQWLWRDNALWIMDGSGALRVQSVLWRLGAVRPHPNHRAVLEMIRLAGVPCVNSAATLLRGYDRLAMLNELREIGLPMLPFSVAVGNRVLESFEPQFPTVLKIGNLHGGWGKARAENREQWNDLTDLAFATDDYATVEPFVDYAQDVRVLIIGDEIWTMSRKSSGWKVNRGVADFELIAAPPLLEEWMRRAQKHLNAEVLALDCLQTQSGEWFVLEYNDIPGLGGFPDAARTALANCLRRKMAGELKQGNYEHSD